MRCSFPYYSGNIYQSECIGHISLEQFIKAHKSPKPVIANLMMNINKARAAGDKELKNKLKTKLFAFTPSVMIEKGKKRQYSNIKHFTGLAQIDLDNIPSLQDTIDLKEHLFHTYEETVCAYISPSRRGVKMLMRITTSEDIEQYRAIHKAISREFQQYDYFDNATKNAILPLFLSSDEKILWRDLADTKIWTEEDWSRKEYVSLNDVPTVPIEDYAEKEQKTVRVITERVGKINDNGHPQIRTASLILGSRVGAGYIDEFTARALIEQLIRNNSYLQKGIAGYITTANWAIGEGMKNPKYY